MTRRGWRLTILNGSRVVVAAAILTSLACTSPVTADESIVEPKAAESPREEIARRVPPSVVVVRGRVSRVHDGDSFALRTADGREQGVRIAGIDAPERTQPYADVSRRALRTLIDRREVRVDVVKTDFYGRLVGNVSVDGHDVGLSQLQAGLAWHFVRYDADLAPAQRRHYAQAERAARERGAGLWQESAPLAPWSFRKQRR